MFQSWTQFCIQKTLQIFFYSGTEIHHSSPVFSPAASEKNQGNPFHSSWATRDWRTIYFLLSLGADILFHPLPLSGWTLKLGIYFTTPFGWCPRLSSNKNRLNNGVLSDWKIPGKCARAQYLQNVILPFPIVRDNPRVHQNILQQAP